MQYSLLIYQTDSQFAARTDPARRDASNGAFGQYVGALKEAGVLLAVLGIEPPTTGAMVRPNGGNAARSSEHLGGQCVIEVADLDAARDWARRAPFDHCAAVEVRPTRIVPMS